MRKLLRASTVIAAIVLMAASVVAAPLAKGFTIIFFEPNNGIVVVRDAETGRTFQFSANATLVRTLKVGDPVEGEIATGQVTGVGGVTGTYKLLPPAGNTCCAVVSLAAAPPRPGIGRLATARHRSTGRTFQFLVDVPEVANALRVGQVVGMLDATNTWALVTLGTTSYSFSVR